MKNNEPNPEGIPKRQWFVTTSWTNLLTARQENSPEAREALENLCRDYWYPLYTYIRRRGYSPEDAEDLVQGFFYQLIERDFLGALDRTKGKFRSFLLASLNHYLAKDRARKLTAKRGGGRVFISLDDQEAEDRFQQEPATDWSPEKIFDCQWARAVLDQAHGHLQAEYAADGKGEVFEVLETFLRNETDAGDYDRVAGQIGLNAKTVAVTVHRLRQRLRELTRQEIARTVAAPNEIDPELQHLFAVLGAAQPA